MSKSPKNTNPTPQITSKVSGSMLDIKKKINIVYFGTTEFSAYILEHLINNLETFSSTFNLGQEETGLRFVVKIVVTAPDKPVGRKQIITASPVSQIAQKYKVPLLKPAALDEEFIKNHYSLLNSELFIVIFYGKIIPQVLLDIPKFGAINVHPSLLPKYRGASPVQAAILNGDRKTGVTIIKMDAKMDHGPILSVSKLAISNEDNTQTLSNKTTQLALRMLLNLLPDFVTGKVTPFEQDDSKAAYCHILKKEDGYFEINDPPSLEKLDRMVRAYFPWPNAWTKWEGKIVKFLPDNMVQMEGKRPVDLGEFLNGYPGFPLKQLLQELAS